MSDTKQHHGFLDSLKSMVVDETPEPSTVHVGVHGVCGKVEEGILEPVKSAKMEKL